jgi:hypothetical protein
VSMEVATGGRPEGFRGAGPGQIPSTLHSPQALLRKYGVAAAARLWPRNREPLAGALSAGDSDVEQFTARPPQASAAA